RHCPGGGGALLLESACLFSSLVHLLLPGVSSASAHPSVSLAVEGSLWVFGGPGVPLDLRAVQPGQRPSFQLALDGSSGNVPARAGLFVAEGSCRILVIADEGERLWPRVRRHVWRGYSILVRPGSRNLLRRPRLGCIGRCGARRAMPEHDAR